MTTETTTQPTSAPSAPPPPAPDSAGSRWTYFKVSEGEIKKSLGKDKDPEVVSHVEGKLLAFRNQEGQIGKETVVAFEVDLEDREGGRLRLSVSHQNLGSSMLATALLTLDVGAWVSIYAQRTKEKNDYGKYGTFVNTKFWNPATGAWADIPVTKTDIDSSAKTWRDAQEAIMGDIASHPAYKDREKGGDTDEGGASFHAFNQAVLEKSNIFPMIHQSPQCAAAYIEWMNTILTAAYGFEGEYLSFEDVSSEHWQNMLDAVEGTKATPAKLKPFLSK